MCCLWYCQVDLCNDRQYSFVYGGRINVVQYNVNVYWLWVKRSRSLGWQSLSFSDSACVYRWPQCRCFPVYIRTVTKTERLPIKGTKSRNPQPLNIHIVFYDINHSPIDKIVLSIITQINMTVPQAGHTFPEFLMMGE